MNKRQYKKKKLKYWRLAGEPYTSKWREGIPYFDVGCPFCGFDATEIDPEELVEMGGKCDIQNLRIYYNGKYSGKQWDEVVKRPICKTQYKFYNTNI